MKTLKMWTGNYDGVRSGLVIATSKTAAAKAVRCSLADFNAHWTQQPGVTEGLEAEKLYTRPMQYRGKDSAPWQLGRCPL